MGKHGDVRAHLASTCPCVTLACPACEGEKAAAAIAGERDAGEMHLREWAALADFPFDLEL